MTEYIYNRLREFLDKMPSGYPATPSGVEIKILKKMFSPEQAELAMELTTTAETAKAISQRTGIDESELEIRLEEMARKGLIFREGKCEIKKYRAFQFIVGIYEFQVQRMDREFSQLFEEYLPYFGMSLATVKTNQQRVVPVESSLKKISGVAPYNRVREMINKEETISLAQCICKKERGLMGKPCKKPQEVCILFGKFAQYYIDNEIGRRIGHDEVFNVLDVAEKAGLVLTLANCQELEGICCCCTCCCPNLRALKMMANPAELIPTYYVAVINNEECIDCGECAQICPMGAIEGKGGVKKVNIIKCIGCGLCINRCNIEAISLTEKGNYENPPIVFNETLNRIASERGASKH